MICQCAQIVRFSVLYPTNHVAILGPERPNASIVLGNDKLNLKHHPETFITSSSYWLKYTFRDTRRHTISFCISGLPGRTIPSPTHDLSGVNPAENRTFASARVLKTHRVARRNPHHMIIAAPHQRSF